jgi:hypothetical protein
MARQKRLRAKNPQEELFFNFEKIKIIRILKILGTVPQICCKFKVKFLCTA